MKDYCSFPGAQRFFVTGAVPKNRMIPNEEHDVESDRAREYNRVSVPSHMWTAACCDSSGAVVADRAKGFSFAYYGENKPDSLVTVSTVRDLNTALLRLYQQESSGSTHQVTIFDDDCNENSQNSQKARSEMNVPVNREISNSLEGLRTVFPSTVHAKKRKNQAIINAMDAKKTRVSSATWGLLDTDIAMFLKRDEVNEMRRELGAFGLSLVLLWTTHTKITSGKRYVNVEHDKILKSSNHSVAYDNKNVASGNKHKQGIRFANRHAELSKPRPENNSHVNEDEDGYNVADKDVYQVVLEALNDGAITIGGDRCRQGTKCDYQGESYKWCYIDWNDNWERCCLTKCQKKSSKDYPVCEVYPGVDYACSIRSSMIAVNGHHCLQDHPCGLHDKNYYWCYTDVKGEKWDYCCQSWHSCDYHGSTYKWCYTGKKVKASWQRCYY